MLFTVFKDKDVDEYAGFVDHRLHIIIRETDSSSVCRKCEPRNRTRFLTRLKQVFFAFYACSGASSSKKSSSRVARRRTRKFVNSSSVFPPYSLPRTSTNLFSILLRRPARNGRGIQGDRDRLHLPGGPLQQGEALGGPGIGRHDAKKNHHHRHGFNHHKELDRWRNDPHWSTI